MHAAAYGDHQPSPLAAGLHFLHVPIHPPPYLLISDGGDPIRNLHVQISLFHTANISFSHGHPPAAGLLLLSCSVLSKRSDLFVCTQRRLLRWELSSRCKKQNKKKISSTPSAVKEKEDLHPDVESQEMNDDTFCEYR